MNSSSVMSSGTKTLLPRVDRHLLTLSAAAVAGVGAVGAVQEAQASIVYSGVLNTNIPANFTGIYLNMENGAVGNSNALPGWDLNPWVTGGNWVLFPAGGNGIVGAANAATNLTSGTLIDAASSYITGSTISLPNGSPALIGIKFTTADASTHFGWLRITTANGATPGTLVDYAWENVANTGINAGATTPAPGSLGLLAFGAVGLLRRRSRA